MRSLLMGSWLGLWCLPFLDWHKHGCYDDFGVCYWCGAEAMKRWWRRRLCFAWHVAYDLDRHYKDLLSYYNWSITTTSRGDNKEYNAWAEGRTDSFGLVFVWLLHLWYKWFMQTSNTTLLIKIGILWYLICRFYSQVFVHMCWLCVFLVGENSYMDFLEWQHGAGNEYTLSHGTSDNQNRKCFRRFLPRNQ